MTGQALQITRSPARRAAFDAMESLTTDPDGLPRVPVVPIGDPDAAARLAAGLHAGRRAPDSAPAERVAARPAA